MTEEQLRQGHNLSNAIWQCARIQECLEKATVKIDKSSISGFYDPPEDEIELLPEEQEALTSLREAYLEIFRTANSRKLNQLKKEFEEL